MLSLTSFMDVMILSKAIPLHILYTKSLVRTLRLHRVLAFAFGHLFVACLWILLWVGSEEIVTVLHNFGVAIRLMLFRLNYCNHSRAHIVNTKKYLKIQKRKYYLQFFIWSWLIRHFNSCFDFTCIRIERVEHYPIGN